ncbi:hypothetical protein EMCRGX_G023856, partial [Ephydatia muelleri]
EKMGDNDEDEDVPLKGKQTLAAKQKKQLEKLMAHPEKLVTIEGSKQWNPSEPPEFVRFYMGSSAGAGSEVFHVYRHLRRKEMLRQDWIQENAKDEELQKEFEERREANLTAAESKTAKKRAKRQRKKQNQHKQAKTDDEGQKANRSESSSDSEDHSKDHFVIGGK